MNYEILNGNELLIQGGKEAGFSLYTGYPGSPLADFFNILNHQKKQLKEEGIRVVIANSEANAAAMASGAKMAGQDTLVAMKSMGLHVASDALSVGNFADSGLVYTDEKTGKKTGPGVVIAVGDDPWSISTSTPADSRYLFKHLHIPFLEPANPRELKDWMGKALTLSQQSSVYCGVLLTTFMAEGGGRVEVTDSKPPRLPEVTLDPSQFDLSKNVMVPPNSLHADRSMIEERFPQVLSTLEELDLDEILGGDKRVGLISTGLVFETLKHVLEKNEWLDQIALYKLASSYPLTEKKLLPFLQNIDHLIVVEEKRGFLEAEVNNFCAEHSLKPVIWGKKFGSLPGFPAHGGLSFEIMEQSLISAFTKLNLNLAWPEKPEVLAVEVPKRLPTFCPGCPHRETLSLLKELRKTLEQKNINLISHGDVGCYSLSFLEPFKEMHDLSAMGQGGAMASGTDLFATNPSVVLMGDSTFFHSGMSAISHSVQCGHQITYILLDNDNTAMTGHQMTPASGVSVDGDDRPRQKMAMIARTLGVEQVHEVNPSDRYFYKNLLDKIVLQEGTKVIVSNKECALTFHGKRKALDRKTFAAGETKPVQEFFQINTLACEDCHVCVDLTGCPGLTVDEDAYGPKIAIDQQICVADSYCTKLQACPSFEQVLVTDYKPVAFVAGQEKQVEVPNGQKQLTDINKQNAFRVVVTGVGGSGVTTISRVLAEAAKNMDEELELDFKFVDQKGLAQRNGSVTGHLCLSHQSSSQCAVTPLGTADLIISPDALEASRALPFLAKTGRVISDSDYQIPLSLIGDERYRSETYDIKELNQQLKELLGDRLQQSNCRTLSFEKWGKSVYASAMCLGMAFQTGELPFSLEQLEQAFARAVPKAELTNNLQAFHFGRGLLTAEPEKREVQDESSRWRASVEDSLASFENGNYILSRFDNCYNTLKVLIPEYANLAARYIHDLMIFDRGKYAEQFIVEVKTLISTYKDPLHFKIALRNLARTYWLKDEVFVSHLMISPAIRERDKKYEKLGSSYEIVFKNRPAIELFGKSYEINISPRRWMFETLRHFRFLRKLFPGWHARDKQIAKQVRQEILQQIPNFSAENQDRRLKELDQIKGYRHVKYEVADKFFSSIKDLG